MQGVGQKNLALVRGVTVMMFMMFAMTTDSVGVIIPEIVKEFHLRLMAAGAFHYATMSAIAAAAMLLGFLADRIGRRRTIVLGLAIFAVNSYLFLVGRSFGFFLCLLALSGVAIGIFKTGALALVGDISTSTTEHTATMNLIEGFFGVGAIVGPLAVSSLIAGGLSWKWLYAVAGTMCVPLIVAALLVQLPQPPPRRGAPVDLRRTLAMARDPYALAFGAAAFLYVAAESAVYVFGPTYFGEYPGSDALRAAYGITAFFVLRAAGRFLGAWTLARLGWTRVMAVCGLAIFVCFAGSVLIGVRAAVVLLPLSGLFMSVVYPTLNSKGISCFAKSEHAAVAGLILFCTCSGAALGPLAMGVVADACGDVRYGFMIATVFAGVLSVGLLFNWIRQPARRHLQHLDQREYGVSAAAGGG